MPAKNYEEVRKHNGPKSAWIIIQNNIYDVTKFLDSHPGGAQSLLDFAGKDGTIAFESVGHSADARSMMNKYKIGTLPLNEQSSHYKSCSPSIISNVDFLVYQAGSGSGLPKTKSEEKTWRTYDGSRDSSKLKWAVLALAGALVLGLVLKKYLS